MKHSATAPADRYAPLVYPVSAATNNNKMETDIPECAACMGAVGWRWRDGVATGGNTTGVPVQQQQPQAVLLHRGLVRRWWWTVLELWVHHCWTGKHNAISAGEAAYYLCLLSIIAL